MPQVVPPEPVLPPSSSTGDRPRRERKPNVKYSAEEYDLTEASATHHALVVQLSRLFVKKYSEGFRTEAFI